METQDIKSHYIPQFYQRGFISDATGLIWVYSADSEPKLVSVRKTGMGLNLYAFRNRQNQLDVTTVEEQLAKLDSDGAAIIKKLQRYQHLNDAEPLSRFLLLQGMWKSNYRGKFVQLPDSDVRTLNRWIVSNASNEVYASKRSKILAEFVRKWISTFNSGRKDEEFHRN